MSTKRAATMDEKGIVDWQFGQQQQAIGGGDNNEGNNIQQQQSVDASAAELNMSIIKRMVQKNLEINQKEKAEAIKKGTIEEEEEEAVEEDEEDEHGGDEGEEEAFENGKNAIGNRRSRAADSVEEEAMKSSPMGNSTTPNEANKLQARKRRDISLSRDPVGQGPDNQTLLRLLEQGEQLHSMFRCARVQGLDTMEGLLLFGKDHFYVIDGFTLLKTHEIRDLDFLPEQFHDPIIPYIAMGCRSRPQSTKTNRQCNKFAYDDIKEVHKRRYLLQQIALEVFSADGRNFLLSFPRKVRDRVYQKLVTMAKRASNDVAQFMLEQKKLRPTDSGAGGPVIGVGGMAVGSSLISQLLTVGSGGQQQSITHKWQRGEISNFHYLMYLNTLAGRSYNDLSQYPVFPWILADYDSDQLDLTNPHSFRDLAKPMGAQSVDRLSEFLKRFREWDDPGGTPPYMYGTHYSSAMIVLSYLVRMEPFTQQFLTLQGGHFDLADRMFHSVRDAFWSAAKNNMADVKELIPEFFYLPEMFLNSNRFDLGVKQSGIRVDDVQLPGWANGDPHEFVRLHRQALESDYVSEHLHEWIDLIFGHKQTGEHAREASNVFHHLFYETSVDIESIADPLQRNATLGFINNFGQIPTQLFKKPHPQRKIQQSLQSAGNPNGTTAAASSQSSPQMIQVLPGLSTFKLFYHTPEHLRVSPRPVKELRAAVGEIVVNEKGNQVVVLEENKVFIPPASFLAWGFHDRAIRFGTVGHDKSICLLETNDVYEITCMASTDGRQVFAGLSTGIVYVWSLSSSSSATSSSSSSSANSSSTKMSSSSSFSSAHSPRLIPKRALVGHSDVITALVASGAHNVLISGSRDRTAIVWHLTRLLFIRQLPGPHPGPVTAVAVNEAKGDIATASGQWLFLWTINGAPLAVVNTLLDAGLFYNSSSIILCIAFSTANDWDENNVVICGTSDGLVKIYSCYRPEQPQQQPAVSDEQCRNVESERQRLNSTSLNGQEQSVKEHLLRRSMRIQQHHSHHYSGQQQQRLGGQQKSIASDTASVTSEASSPISSSFSRQSSQQQQQPAKEQPQQQPTSSQQQQQQIVPVTMESIKWIRALKLRRILSEYTAFHAGNAQPAPITAIRPTKDHRSLLVGDGIGRIWMWTICGNAGESASSE